MVADLLIPLLGQKDGPALERLNPLGQGTLLLACPHGAYRLPERLGTLGLLRDRTESEYAWDIGTAALSERLSDLMDVPAIIQRFSRLAVDCDRGPDCVDVVPHVCGQRVIAANVALSPQALAARVAALHTPFHQAIETGLNTISRRSPTPALVNILSFADQGTERDRMADIIVHHGKDARLADAVIELLGHDGTYSADRFEFGPNGNTASYILQRHGIRRGILHVALQIRGGLIAAPGGQDRMARYLASLLKMAVATVTSSRPDLPPQTGALHDLL